MLLIRRATVYLLNLFNLFLFYLVLTRPELIYYSLAGLALSTILATFLITGRQERIKEKFWLWSSACLFWFANVCFLLILESHYLAYFLLFLLFIISYFYWQSLWYYYQAPTQYRPHTLVYLYNYSSLLSVFFLTAAGFAFDVFLSQNFWLLPLVIGFLITIIFSQNLWFNKINFSEKKRDLLTFWLLLTELTFLFCWWPISYYVKAILITSAYFIISNFLIARHNKETRFTAWYYPLIIFMITFIILLTARWY